MIAQPAWRLLDNRGELVLSLPVTAEEVQHLQCDAFLEASLSSIQDLYKRSCASKLCGKCMTMGCKSKERSGSKESKEPGV